MHTNRHRAFIPKSGAILALVVSLLLVTLAPFSSALAIHHDLAAADHDGHQHSDNDLCQWVQYHTGQSLIAEVPAVCSLFQPIEPAPPRPGFLVSLSLPAATASRAPPRF